MSEQIHKLRREVEKEFPVVARLTAASLGPLLLWSTRREENRLALGRTYERPHLGRALQLDCGFVAPPGLRTPLILPLFDGVPTQLCHAVELLANRGRISFCADSKSSPKAIGRALSVTKRSNWNCAELDSSGVDHERKMEM